MERRKYKNYFIVKRKANYGDSSYWYDVQDDEGFSMDDHGFTSIESAKEFINKLIEKKKQKQLAGLF